MDAGNAEQRRSLKLVDAAEAPDTGPAIASAATTATVAAAERCLKVDIMVLLLLLGRRVSPGSAEQRPS
jgi:hypothetical protein